MTIVLTAENNIVDDEANNELQNHKEPQNCDSFNR